MGVLDDISRLSGPQKGLVLAIIAGGAYYASRKALAGPRPRRGDRESEDASASTRKSLPQKKSRKDFIPRFVRVLKILFSGRDRNNSIMTLIALSGLLVTRTLLSIRVAVTTGEVAQKIVQVDWEGFVAAVTKFALIGIPAALVNSGLKYCTSMLALRFRRRLTGHINDRYIVGVNFYKANQLPASKIENVDQRVTADVEAFCRELAELYTSVFKPVLDIVLNTLKLSTVMGFKAPIVLFVYYLTLAKIKMTVLKALDIKRVTERRSELDGDYRTAHSRLIACSEEIAFFEGDTREKGIISSIFGKLFRHTAYVHKLHAIVGIMDQYLAKYGSSITGYMLLCVPAFFPQTTGPRTEADLARDYVLNRQLLMDLAVGIGTLLSTTTTIATFMGLTSRVMEVLEAVSNLDADVAADFVPRPPEEGEETVGEGGGASAVPDEWLEQWAQRTDELRAMRSGEVVAPQKGVTEGSSVVVGDTISLKGVTIVSPDGRVLVEDLNLDVPAGMNIMVTGPNGCGKSSLFRVLGSLWPVYKGTVVRPSKKDLVFVPQRPYLVMGTLRDQIIYPHTQADMVARGIKDEDLAVLLDIVDPARSILHEWTFDSVRNWSTAFSGGQKQRVAMARVFYNRPRYAILDECTSAVSSEVEGTIYQTCRQLGITLFTVSHRPNLQQYHDKQVRFDGHGSYWVYTTEEVLEGGKGQL